MQVEEEFPDEGPDARGLARHAWDALEQHELCRSATGAGAPRGGRTFRSASSRLLIAAGVADCCSGCNSSRNDCATSESSAVSARAIAEAKERLGIRFELASDLPPCRLRAALVRCYACSSRRAHPCVSRNLCQRCSFCPDEPSDRASSALVQAHPGEACWQCELVVFRRSS